MGVTTKLMGAMLALIFFACDAQDPRESRVLVNDDSGKLQVVTQQAIDFWYEAAPNQLDVRIANTCNQDDYQCIFIDWSDLVGRDGTCRNLWSASGELTSIIHIDVDINNGDRVRRVVAHELGHAFSLKHVEPDEDLMQPNGGKCITEATVAEWMLRFSNSLNHVCLP